eukprot:scaffold1336_cov158-Cylindrotheca_fusiformis.AAC.5
MTNNFRCEELACGPNPSRPGRRRVVGLREINLPIHSTVSDFLAFGIKDIRRPRTPTYLPERQKTDVAMFSVEPHPKGKKHGSPTADDALNPFPPGIESLFHPYLSCCCSFNIRMSTQARGLQNFISDLRNAKSKVRMTAMTTMTTVSKPVRWWYSLGKTQCGPARQSSFMSVDCGMLHRTPAPK